VLFNISVPTAVYTDHPVSTKTAGFIHPTIYSFLRLDCLLLAPSLSPAIARGTTYRSTSPQHRLCSPSENDCICFDFHILT